LLDAAAAARVAGFKANRWIQLPLLHHVYILMRSSVFSYIYTNIDK
jgi:hypothetical protein